MTEWKPYRLAGITAQERRELLGLVKRGADDGGAKVVEAFIPTEDEGQYELVPGPFVGRFALGSGRVLDVSSALIPAVELPEVLRIAGHLPIRLDDTPTRAEPGWGIVDLIALALASEAERIIGQGIAKDYELRRFRSPPLPGTLDVREHLNRHAGRPDKLVTVARRLTSDITRNQALATATSVLLRLPLQPLARRRLRRVAAALSTVSTPVMSAGDVLRQLGHRRQQRYDPALRLCALVLEGGTIASSGEQLTGASVLFSMTRVWEDFVLAWVRRQAPAGHVQAQHDFTLVDGRTSPVAWADVVVLDSAGQPAQLYDAKYKRARPVPAADDIYQMVTYCERLGLDEATLVHPGQGESTEVFIGRRRIRTTRLSVEDLPGQVAMSTKRE